MKQLILKSGFTLFSIMFLFTTSITAQNNVQEKRVFIKIEIMGLACPYCAYGMEKELKKVSGVDDKVVIELKEGLAYISTPISQKPTKESLEKIIVDSGFTVGKIEFSDVPFKKTESND